MRSIKKIADFIALSTLKSHPTQAAREAKRCILDSIGVTLAGSCNKSIDILIEYLRENYSQGKSTVIGREQKTASPSAALINATSGHILDYDDLSNSFIGHPSIPVVASAFAVGEEYGSSGQEVLNAFIVGIEVSSKMGKASTQKPYKKGFHLSKILGVFGSVAAAGKLMALDHHQLMNALSIASSDCSGLRENFGSMTKAFHLGRAAESGIMAAKLARRGFTGSRTSLEGRAGFFSVITESDQYEDVIREIGQHYEIIHPGITTKLYPSCGSTHSAIECISRLLKQRTFSLNDIRSVRCGTDSATADMLMYKHPTNPLEAKFSMHYCIGTALLKGSVSLNDFSEESVGNELIHELIKRVEFYVDPEMDSKAYGALDAKIEIHLVSGEKISAVGLFTDIPRQLSYDKVVSKFNDCVRPYLGKDKILELKRKIEGLENEECISTITELLT